MSRLFKIAIGSDHAGFNHKEKIGTLLRKLGHEVIDVGTNSEDSCDYPLYAREVCLKVKRGEVHRGILICGSGIGISIAANKFPGIRCALCHDSYTARMCREHNDANVLAFGERTTGIAVAEEMVRIFLNTDFDSTHPNHTRRVQLISSFESEDLSI
jgi:ribose 5-phosphate isomerase B